jgi:hypothetical protein
VQTTSPAAGAVQSCGTQNPRVGGFSIAVTQVLCGATDRRFCVVLVIIATPNYYFRGSEGCEGCQKTRDRFIRYILFSVVSLFLSSHYFLCASKSSHLKFPRSVQINPHFFLQTSPSTFPNQRNQNNIARCRSSGSERRSARSTRTTCGAWTR